MGLVPVQELRRLPDDGELGLEFADPTPGGTEFDGLAGADAGALAAVDLVVTNPAVQAPGADAQLVGGLLPERISATARARNGG